MSFKIEKKENYTHVRFGGDTFESSEAKELLNYLNKSPHGHTVVNLLQVEEISAIDQLDDIRLDWEDENFHLIVVIRDALSIQFPEEFPIASSLNEAGELLNELLDE